MWYLSALSLSLLMSTNSVRSTYDNWYSCELFSNNMELFRFVQIILTNRCIYRILFFVNREYTLYTKINHGLQKINLVFQRNMMRPCSLTIAQQN